MPHKKTKKGSYITGLVSVMVVLVALSIAMERVGGEFIWSTSESFNLYNKYFTLTMDKQVQSLKQGFEKTAAFFSLNSASKELAEHGGHARETLMDSDSNNIVDATQDLEPKILVKKDIESGESIPFWTIPNCQTTLKRVPYLMDEDVNRVAGNIAISLMQNDAQHMQYINEINAGAGEIKYPLYVSIQLFMMKPGEVTFACHSILGCNNIEALPGTPLITNTVTTDGIVTNAITKDGIYSYKIDSINPDEPLSLHVFAKNESDEIDDVARIKQVTVSIYDPQIFTTPNELFTKRLDEYYTGLNTILEERNKREKIKLKISPLTGTMTKGKEDYVEGIVWPDENVDSITSYMDNPFFKKRKLKLAELRDSGIITEETKIRYYTLYDNAEKFTDISQQLFQSRLWSMLHNLDTLHGCSLRERIVCGERLRKCDSEVSCSGGRYCQPDEVPSYDRDHIYSAIDQTIQDIKDEYNTLTADEGISWHIEYPDNFFEDFSKVTNRDKDACDAAEHIETENFEYLEYIRRDFMYAGIGTICDCPQECRGPYGNRCRPPHCTYWCYKNKCRMHYDRRYVLKNLKIYVKITDDDYKIYDTATNTWENLEFKFYVTVPIVDMNCCGGDETGGHNCEDHKTVCSNPYGAISAHDAFNPAGDFKITTGPVATTADNSATILWTTNMQSTSVIKYSATQGGPYTDITDDSEIVVHRFTISGLDVSTKYYYIVESTAGGKTVTSAQKSFTTSHDVTEPKIKFTKPSEEESKEWMTSIVYLEVEATDNLGIDHVDFYFCKDGTSDAKLIEVPSGSSTCSADTTAPYSCTVNIKNMVDNPSDLCGVYNIKAIASDKFTPPNQASADVTVKVREEVKAEITDIETSTASSGATVKWTTIGTSGIFEYCYNDADCHSTGFEDLIIAAGEEDAYDGPYDYLVSYKKQISGLSSGTRYTYTISVDIGGEEMPLTSTGTFTTQGPPPVISALTVQRVDPEATITWATNLDSTCTLSAMASSHTSEGTLHEIKLDGLTAGTSYDYEITCYRTDNKDADPAIVSGTIK